MPDVLPKKSGGSTFKIVLIVVAVIVGLGILGVGTIGFIGYRIAKNMHVDPSGKVTMNTPAGTIVTTPADNLSASDLGVDIYPGAQSTHGGNRSETPDGSGVTGMYLTSDSPAQVAAFYKTKLGSSATVTSIFGHTGIGVKLGSKDSVQISIFAGSSRDEGKTVITIMHMMQKAS